MNLGNWRYLLKAFLLGTLVIDLTSSCYYPDPVRSSLDYRLASKSDDNVVWPQANEAILFLWINPFAPTDHLEVRIAGVEIPGAKPQYLIRAHLAPGRVRLYYSDRPSHTEETTVILVPGTKRHVEAMFEWREYTAEQGIRLEHLNRRTQVIRLCAHNTRLCAEGEAMPPPAAAPPAPATQ